MNALKRTKIFPGSPFQTFQQRTFALSSQLTLPFLEGLKLVETMNSASQINEGEDLSTASINFPKHAIVAGYSVYRDAWTLKDSMNSLADYVDAILVLSGKTAKQRISFEDGTNRIVSEVASRFDPGRTGKIGSFKVQLYNMFECGEAEKRSQLFALTRPGNFLILMETNEILCGDVLKGFDYVRSHPEKKIFWVEKSNGLWYPKIIRIEPGLHYASHRYRRDGFDTYDILDKDSRQFTCRNDFLNHSSYEETIFDFRFCDA